MTTRALFLVYTTAGDVEEVIASSETAGVAIERRMIVKGHVFCLWYIGS